jgi:holo-[acyl-carrier protein] synthase
MIKGIGIDIIKIARMRNAVKRFGAYFLQKIFTPHELRSCRSHKTFKFPELATRFAAKEAFSKALGSGIAGFGRKNKGLNLTEIEIRLGEQGNPLIIYQGKTVKKATVSLTSSRDYALAAVYVEN